jgi:hypothetical protein
MSVPLIRRIKTAIELAALCRLASGSSWKARELRDAYELHLRLLTDDEQLRQRVRQVVARFAEHWAETGHTCAVRRAKRDAADRASRADMRAMWAAVEQLPGRNAA